MSEERYPLTNTEYQALRGLFACMSVFQVYKDHGIDKRLKKCGAWKWYRLAETFTEKAIDVFLRTIPANKLKAIMRDVQHIKMDVYVDGVTGQRRHDKAFFVDEDVINSITGYACRAECEFCTKRGGDVKKCKLRKSIINVVPWDLKTLDADGHCNLSGEIHFLSADENLPFCENMDDLKEEWDFDEHPQEVKRR